MKKIFKKRKAVVLIMSLIILSGLLIVAVEFSIFFISTIKFNRNIDNSLTSYYAAESGAESGLYQIWAEGLSNDTLRKNNETMGAKNNISWRMDDSTTFDNTIESYERTLLQKNNSVEFHMYDSDGLRLLNPTPKSMKITWDAANNCSVETVPWMEFTIAKWQSNGATIDWEDTNQLVKYLRTPDSASPNQLVFNDLNSNDLMIIRTKALYCDLQGLNVTFYDAADASGNIVKIPNFYMLKPIGKYADTQQAVKVTVPKKAPLSGLYDYVLYSDDTVSK